MIRKSAHKDIENPPGQVVNHFELPLEKAIKEYQQDLIEKLQKRAQIRRQISSRKSVQEGKPDRIADLLEEAAEELINMKILLTIANADPLKSPGNRR